MVEVNKRDGESPESLLRRFTKRVQSSGVLIHAKKGRYHTKQPSKLEAKETAARRGEIKEKKEFLRKIGKLDDYIDPRRPNKRGTIKKLLQAKVRK